jgi:hypothetical protein
VVEKDDEFPRRAKRKQEVPADIEIKKEEPV